jgi:curli production assembly/transport component CsgF
MKQLVTVAFIVLGIQSLLAQDLVYKPKIPFWWTLLYYQWLASSAESQNKFTDKTIKKNHKQS